MAQPDTVRHRITSGIPVVRLFQKQEGDLVEKVLFFVLQMLFLMSLTFYAAANSSAAGGVLMGVPPGGIMFLYALTIGASWVLLQIVIHVVGDKNILVAGKFPLTLALLVLLVFIFLCVIIGSIVAAGAVSIGAGVLIGYFILTWICAELLQAVAIFVGHRFGPKTSAFGAGGNDDDEDEYAESRGTFTGVDESVAVAGDSPEPASSTATRATTDGVEDPEDPMASMQGAGSALDEDDDLGLL